MKGQMNTKTPTSRTAGRSIRTPEQPVQREFLSVTEFAQWFGVVEDTVRLWIRQGSIRAVKVGAQSYWRIPISECDRLAAGDSAQTDPSPSPHDSGGGNHEQSASSPLGAD